MNFAVMVRLPEFWSKSLYAPLGYFLNAQIDYNWEHWDSDNFKTQLRFCSLLTTNIHVSCKHQDAFLKKMVTFGNVTLIKILYCACSYEDHSIPWPWPSFQIMLKKVIIFKASILHYLLAERPSYDTTTFIFSINIRILC